MKRILMLLKGLGDILLHTEGIILQDFFRNALFLEHRPESILGLTVAIRLHQEIGIFHCFQFPDCHRPHILQHIDDTEILQYPGNEFFVTITPVKLLFLTRIAQQAQGLAVQIVAIVGGSIVADYFQSQEVEGFFVQIG